MTPEYHLLKSTHMGKEPSYTLPWYLKLIFWNTKRGSILYDVICVSIVAALLVSPLKNPPTRMLDDRDLSASRFQEKIDKGDSTYLFSLRVPIQLQKAEVLQRIEDEIRALYPELDWHYWDMSWQINREGLIVGVWVVATRTS